MCPRSFWRHPDEADAILTACVIQILLQPSGQRVPSETGTGVAGALACLVCKNEGNL